MPYRWVVLGFALSITLGSVPVVAQQTPARWPNNFSIERLMANCGEYEWKVVNDSMKFHRHEDDESLPKCPGFFRSRQIIAKGRLPHSAQADFAQRFAEAVWTTLDGSGARKTSVGGPANVIGDRNGLTSYVWSATYTFARNGKSGHITAQMTSENDRVTLFVLLMEET